MDWCYLYSILISSPSGIIGTWVAATGAVAAWLTLFFEVRRRQAERRIAMKSEYDELFTARETYWTELRRAYGIFRSTPSDPENLENLIRSAGAPPGLGKVDLISWPQDYGTRLGPDQRTIWSFAQAVYPPRDNRAGKVTDYSLVASAGGDPKEFHESRAKLAKFWDKWSQVLSTASVARTYTAAYDQRIMLSWLELALAQWTRDPGKGKVGLFRLAGHT